MEVSVKPLLVISSQPEGTPKIMLSKLLARAMLMLSPISNLDLAERFSSGADAELNKYDRATFYGGGTEGYTDYPFSTSKA